MIVLKVEQKRDMAMIQSAFNELQRQINKMPGSNTRMIPVERE